MKLTVPAVHCSIMVLKDDLRIKELVWNDSPLWKLATHRHGIEVVRAVAFI